MQIFDKKDVTNVLLFTGGLDSVLSYLKLKDKTPNLELVYTPIYIKGSPHYVNGEVETLKVMANVTTGFLDHPLQFFNSAARAWDTAWFDKDDPTFIPYRIPMIIGFVLLTYPNVKNIWISGMLDDDNPELHKENIKKLQIALREFGKNKDFSIVSPFDWKLFKHEAIHELLKNVSDDSKKILEITKAILYSFSSYNYTTIADRNKVKNWVNENMQFMNFPYKEIRVAVSSVLNSRNEIPSIDRRPFNTEADFELNVALYNGLGLTLPFFDRHLMESMKLKALDSKNNMSPKKRKAILDYIAAYDELLYRRDIKSELEVAKFKKSTK